MIRYLTFYLTGIKPLFELFFLMSKQQRLYFLPNCISRLPVVRVQVFELLGIYALNRLFDITCNLWLGDFVETNILSKHFCQLLLFAFRR